MEDISGAEAGRCFALTQQPHEGAETVAGRGPGVNHSLLERAAVMSSCQLGPFFPFRSGLLHPAHAAPAGLSSPSSSTSSPVTRWPRRPMGRSQQRPRRRGKRTLRGKARSDWPRSDSDCLICERLNIYNRKGGAKSSSLASCPSVLESRQCNAILVSLICSVVTNPGSDFMRNHRRRNHVRRCQPEMR